MATLVEEEIFEPGVYQLEKTDPVQGGANGIDNLQAKQLANRTKWLNLNKQDKDAALTAIAALVTAADKLIYATGLDTFATTTLTAFARTLLDDVDAAAMRATLGAVSQADINSAISALVNSSPAALDTLNELASALGNDANFATTMTNALANKQDKDATLTAIASLVSSADKMFYATGSDTFEITPLTAFARTLLDDVDAATMRATLGITSVSGVRQTVQSALVDSNGFANFIAIGAGLSVNISAATVPIKIHASGGSSNNDRVGTISADTAILNLTANTTNYLYADIASNGTVTLGSTTYMPIYQFGGGVDASLGRTTFNISEMKGYTGNGASAPQSWRVFIGEAVTGASSVTSIINYALNGMYDSGWTNTLPNSATQIAKNHNIGVVPEKTNMSIKCLTIDQNYSVGQVVDNFLHTASTSVTAPSIAKTETVLKYRSASPGTPFVLTNALNGNSGAATLSSWAYKFTARRGW